jgi:hypothetical protein
MKKTFTLIYFVIFLFLTPKAQEIRGKKDNASAISKYNRSALTIMILDNHNPYMNYLSRAASGIIVPDKYDNNMLSTRVLKANPRTPEGIKKALIEQKIPNKIIAKWYDRDKSGRFHMDVIFNRGMYNATADDLKIALSSKKGIAMLKDAGEKLVNNSYIMLLEFTNIQNVSKTNSKKNGYTADVTAYFYRINFNDSIINIFYNDLWINDDDSEATIAQKKAKFDKMNFPLDFVIAVKGTADGTQWNKGESLAPPRQLTKEELFQKLINTGISSTLFQVERKIEDFRLKAPLYGTKPLKSKVGAKEGLKSDYRFFVIDLKQKKNGNLKAIRKGVVRVKKVGNNKTVINQNSKIYTTFYQVAGRHLEPGMVLQQRNDLGIGISGGWAFGEIGGAYIKGELNLSILAGRFGGFNLGANQLKAFGSVGWQNKEYGHYDFSFLRWNVGLSKGWYFAHHFSFAILAAYGQETATCTEFMNDIGTNSDNYIKTDMLDFGAYLTINITYWMQIMATFNYYVPFGEAVNDEGESWAGYEYKDFFDGRNGMSIDVGLRIDL